MQRGAAKTFEDLVVWQKAHQFVLGIYELTSRFPPEELYGLTSQLRRAAVSIAANIAEGFKRRGRDKLRFMNVSQSSVEECRYYLLLSSDLGLGKTHKLKTDLEEISKLLHRYYTTIRDSEFSISVFSSS